MEKTFYSLELGSEEQTISLLNGYTAEILFDRCYKRWYYNLYKDDAIVAAGVALNPNTAPLLNYINESLGLLDTGSSKEDYEPYYELGNRLALVEISE